MSDDLNVRPGRLQITSKLGMSRNPVKLYQNVETPINSTLMNPFRLIGGFGTHKFLFIFEIPPSTCYDLIHGIPTKGISGESVIVYDFGHQVGVEYEFPMKFILYRLGGSPFLHFRSVLNNEKRAEHVIPIIRDIKNSNLSAAIIDETGTIVQTEKLACCQRGSKGGLCFRIKDFVSLHQLAADGLPLLTRNGSLMIRLQFIGSNLSPQPQIDSSTEGNAQYTLDSKFRNLLYQLVRDEEFNSFLRSWASNTKFANVKLRIQDKNNKVTILPAHRVLLSAQTDALGGYLRPKEEVVVLEGFHHFTLLVMLDYIYSGEIHCNDLATLVNLAELGERMEVYGLKDKCIRDIIMMFNNSVTNVKHIVACYKLGEMLNSPLMIDKAVECFRVMKHCDQCIDFPYGKALMLIAGSENEEEFNKFLNLLYEKSRPVQENVRNLVQFPADEVKLLGTSSENWIGYIYIIPASLCKRIAECCLTGNGTTTSEPFSILQELETEEGFFELVKNNDGGINLCVTSTTDSYDGSAETEEGLERMVNSLGISRSDYLSVIAESIGMTLKASLFDSEGRIITANMTRGILVDGNHYVWEVNSFITQKMMANWDKTTEMLLRISFGAPQLHPTFRVIPPYDHRYLHYRKYGTTFLQKVNTDPYTSRLLAQLQYGADADAQINVLGEDNVVLFSTPVHAVILSAMSSRFENCFTVSHDLEINIENYSVDAIQMLLHFIYGQDITPSHIDLVLELISCGDKFEVKGLLDKCVDKLCSCQLNLETCIHLYEIGIGTQCMPLKDIAIKYFRRNRATVEKFKDFKRLIRRHPKILEVIND